MQLKPYVHTVHYYETDKMGITHHSNYIRWMEEARVDFLDQVGWSFDRMESMGLVSPVLEVNCVYKKSTVFNQRVQILVRVKEYKTLKLWLEYEIRDAADGSLCARGNSCHCFMGTDGKPLFMEKEYPEFFAVMTGELTYGDGK